MGSQSKINLAYIAGFLDGDGSLMLQVKKRKDGKLKRRFMATICFYQDSRHERTLSWIHKVLEIGYISRRNDGITELRINGVKQIKDILEKLMPFIKFKRKQAIALYNAVKILDNNGLNNLSNKKLIKLIDYVLTIQKNNYVTKKKKTRDELFKSLDLAP